MKSRNVYIFSMSTVLRAMRLADSAFVCLMPLSSANWNVDEAQGKQIMHHVFIDETPQKPNYLVIADCIIFYIQRLYHHMNWKNQVLLSLKLAITVDFAIPNALVQTCNIVRPGPGARIARW